MFTLFCALLTAPIRVPASFYSLAELGQVIRAQGLAVEVAPSVANEVYAVRFSGTPMEQIGDSLRKSGRLDVREQGGKWIIERAKGDLEADRDALRRFLKLKLDPGIALCTEAARLAFEWQQMELADEQDAFEQYRQGAKAGSDHEKIGRLLYTVSSAPEEPFEALSLPPAVARGFRSGIARFTTFRRAENPALFSPRPMRTFGGGPPTLANQRYIFPSYALAKMMIEPASGVITSRLIRVFDQPQMYLSHRVWAEIASAGWPSPEKVLSAEAMRDLATRPTDITQSLRPIPNSDRPRTLSEVALSVAEANSLDLVCYSSPFLDRPLPPEETASLDRALAAANLQNNDPDFCKVSRMERTGSFYLPPKEPTWPRFTSTLAGSRLVLRTEADFIDLLLDGPTSVATRLRNQDWKGETLAMQDILDEANTLPIASWKGSNFSDNYLRYTNPLTILPLARAAKASPTFAKWLTESLAKGQGQIPWKELDATTVRKLIEGMDLVAPLCDMLEQYPSVPDAAVVMSQAHDNGFESFAQCRWQVTRKEGRTFIELAFGENHYLWRAWLSDRLATNTFK